MHVMGHKHNVKHSVKHSVEVASMELQVAMDRLSIEEAVRLARLVAPYADWIEVGTSLIKEFGMDSVRQMRSALPEARVLADVKTNDNARYEFELCFHAGADAATVMGTAPDATVDLCVTVAREHRKTAFIDLLKTSDERQRELLRYRDAIFGVHVSKDVQESGGKEAATMTSRLPQWVAEVTAAAAGGITLADIPALGARAPQLIVIVGSAITGAPNAAQAARAFAEAMGAHRIQPDTAGSESIIHGN